ncbi:MAG: ribbon-helix-helix protein, CopG family [Acidimicrobiia bacterium]|nr:ribbon-helix-helix protein, CopG family [Acidimicrobiia bacterium]
MGASLPRSGRGVVDPWDAVEARAEAEHTTTSEIIREALRRFLDVADLTVRLAFVY